MKSRKKDEMPAPKARDRDREPAEREPLEASAARSDAQHEAPLRPIDRQIERAESEGMVLESAKISSGRRSGSTEIER